MPESTKTNRNLLRGNGGTERLSHSLQATQQEAAAPVLLRSLSTGESLVRRWPDTGAAEPPAHTGATCLPLSALRNVQPQRFVIQSTLTGLPLPLQKLGVAQGGRPVFPRPEAGPGPAGEFPYPKPPGGQPLAPPIRKPVLTRTADNGSRPAAHGACWPRPLLPRPRRRRHSDRRPRLRAGSSSH